MDGNQKFMTLAEMAAAARVSKRTIERRVAAGEIAVLRIGRCVRVPVDALTTFGIPQQVTNQ